MEIATGTATDLVGKILGFVGSTVGRQVGYLIHYKRNLENLQTEVARLSAAKDTVSTKITVAEAMGEKIYPAVQLWLENVARITKEAEELLKDKQQATVEDANNSSKDDGQPKTKCVHGFCPNPVLRRRRSKNSLELVDKVTKLINEAKEPSDISYVVPPEDVCIASDEDYEEFDSRSQIVEKILKELRSTSSSDMILVYGVGGVGKTTLVEEVLRKAQKEKLFQDAVMVRDVKVPNLEAIQKQIADKLGLKNILEAHTLPGRVDKINERVKNKNTLVIFDDVWEEIDLKAVGLPHKSTCRILLTSRSQQVFSHKIKQKEFQLGVLDDKEAWALFENKAGDVVADPTIRPVAAQVAKKCGGLPVLVITVARALGNKNLPIWKNALKQLERFDEKGDLTHKAYSGIEWSYTQLSDKEQLQSLFLLCGSIAMGNNISLTTLLKYSIGLGFFHDCTVEEARNALDGQVDKLKSCCLLLDGDDGTCVRMHDLVRDVANRIARRDQHALVEDGGHNKLEKWPDEEFFSECSKICFPCCNIATLRHVPWDCPKLEMFHLHRKYDDKRKNDDDSSPSLPEMPSNFFEEMKRLKVLGLSNVSPARLIPPSFLFPKNLQTLCLDGCVLKDIALVGVGELRNLEVLSMVHSDVRQLPQEFGQLTRLRLVDLSDCFSLEVIPAGVISNWTKLEDLRLRNSFDKWEGTAKEYEIKESDSETSIASLSELMTLPNLTALEVHIPDIDILPPKFFSDKLEKYQISLGGQHFGLMEETTLNTLELHHYRRFELNDNVKILLKKCDIFTLKVHVGDFSYLMKTKVVMSNLTTLEVTSCDGFKYLFTSSMVRSLVKLKYLVVRGCRDMEEIVSTIESPEEDVDNIFAKLERLTLKDLPKFARFCTAGSCIDFPLLEELNVQGWNKLGESATYPGKVLFDEKVRFPRLEILKIIKYREETVLKKIWHNQLAPGSFCRLRRFKLENCSGVSSIFPQSMTGRLSGLETDAAEIDIVGIHQR